MIAATAVTVLVSTMTAAVSTAAAMISSDHFDYSLLRVECKEGGNVPSIEEGVE
jgi:hypothetical protein